MAPRDMQFDNMSLKSPQFRLRVLPKDEPQVNGRDVPLAGHQGLELGMPHLDIFGLSEMFCLTNAGNHHWSLISKMAARKPTEWKSSRGERVYASFVYTSISYYRQFMVQEGDHVAVHCVPLGFASPFFVTETKYLNGQGDMLARVKMMSSFLVKDGPGNGRFARSSIFIDQEPFGGEILEATQKRYKEMYRFDDSGLAKKAEHAINPSVDFNAANFMYFANYSQIFKRYESPELSSAVPMKSREIAYFANIDPFEQLAIYAREEDMNVLSAMKRSSDQKCIARSSSVNCRR